MGFFQNLSPQDIIFKNFLRISSWNVIRITNAVVNEISFRAVSNPACGVSESCDDENLWQWSHQEIRLNTFCRSLHATIKATFEEKITS